MKKYTFQELLDIEIWERFDIIGKMTQDERNEVTLTITKEKMEELIKSFEEFNDE